MRKSILVMSGKGGVGKTTVAINLSYSLFKKGFSVGILDVDLHGPNVLKMFGYENVRLDSINNKLMPLIVNPKLKIASIAGYIDDKSATIWRGPRKHGVIKQLSEDVNWGELDYLIVDFPPGTGDEHISTAQILTDIKGAVIVSTPQSVSIMDMDRTFDFCKHMQIPILGVIENMSGGIFGNDSVRKKCVNDNLNFLGKLTLSENIVLASEEGKPFVSNDDQIINNDFNKIIKNLLEEIK